MLRRNTEAKQRWGGQDTALDRWLEERQLLLVQYCQLAGLPPYGSGNGQSQLPATSDIHDFCETLVDYVSAGHFELYDQILKQANEYDEHTREVAEHVYPLIAVTTEAALKFNDQYAEVSDQDSMKSFDQELSTLGEAIELRLELEDKLLQLLSNRELIADKS
ncbi:MAG: sigma D regulator [Idiomarina sp.]|nr:sigma D regulator [Idiomarina sp.]